MKILEKWAYLAIRCSTRNNIFHIQLKTPKNPNLKSLAKNLFGIENYSQNDLGDLSTDLYCRQHSRKLEEKNSTFWQHNYILNITTNRIKSNTNNVIWGGRRCILTLEHKKNFEALGGELLQYASIEITCTTVIQALQFRA